MFLIIAEIGGIFDNNYLKLINILLISNLNDKFW